MIKIEEIKKKINSLSMKDFNKLKDWIIEKDWHYWEKEIQNDSENGKLDFIIEEAQEGKTLVRKLYIMTFATNNDNVVSGNFVNQTMFISNPS